MIEKIAEVVNQSGLIGLLIRELCRYSHVGTDYWRYLIGSLERPHYAYLLLRAAEAARSFGLREVTVIEFGVGGGGGLKTFEEYSTWVERKTNVKFLFIGFDTGTGMPRSNSPFDLPYVWHEGQFDMRASNSLDKLSKSRLVLGQISKSISNFVLDRNFPPIGAVAFDVDYYTSTLDALKLFNQDPSLFLPRIPLYFDDCIGTELEMHTDFIGERRAIREYNDSQEKVKVGQSVYLSTSSSKMRWKHKIWYAHFFQHPRYSERVANLN